MDCLHKAFAEVASHLDVDAGVITARDDTMRSVSLFVKQRCLVTRSWQKRKMEFVLSDGRSQPIGLHGNIPSNEVFRSLSPSRKTLVAMQKIEENGSCRYIVEVHSLSSDTGVVRAVETTHLHSDVYTEETFSSFAWSDDEVYFAFIGELKERKSSATHIFPGSPPPNASEAATIDSHWEDSWGENYEGKRAPCVIVVDTNSLSARVPSLPGSIAPAEACWASTQSPQHFQDGLFFIAHSNNPRRLGARFCQQRRCKLMWVKNPFSMDQPSECTEIHSEYPIYRSPRLSPSGKHLVFLSCDEGSYTHQLCLRLMMLNLETVSASTLVDVVDTPEPSDVPGMHGMGFPGLYLWRLPSSPWIDDKWIILSSLWGSRTVPLLVDTTEEQSYPTLLDGLAPMDSYTILDVWDDLLLFASSNPETPSQVALAKLSRGSDPSPASWVLSSIAVYKPSYESRIAAEVLTCPRAGSLVWPPQIIFMRPKSQDSLSVPLVVYAHGGPHSAFNTSFDTTMALLISQGYAVAKVNYRGSIGFGKSSLESLLGRVGSQDVEDVHTCRKLVLEQYPQLLDSSRVAIIGGSHGGFLSCHMIGQFPEDYKAAVVRNPVTNIASMISTTDIPDWCATEVGLQYSGATTLSGEVLNQMWNSSPLQYAASVKSPILICLGKNDLRVPNQQGIEYYQALLELGVETKMGLTAKCEIFVRLFIYSPDGHALVSPKTEVDFWLRTCNWLAEYL